MKRMLKSQQKNPLFKKKTMDQKPDIKPDVKPNSKALKKLNKSTNNDDENENEDELAGYAGTTAEKGSKFKTRPQWKLREENANHNKTVKSQKKMIRKQNLIKEIRAEKRQIDRTKMGKRNPKDADSSLVNKYLKLLHNKNQDSQAKPKRSKWYVD